MAVNLSELKERLKNNNYKLTWQRRAVLMLLIENSDEHLNAEEIYDLLRRMDSGIGLATVYRTLAILEKLNIVRRIYLDDGCIRYQYKDLLERHEHHHLICKKCGNVTDMRNDLLELLEKQVFLEKGFKVTNHRVKLYGICRKCLGEKTYYRSAKERG
jgi:Fur family ferric uptake transcriptional regulator